MEAYLQLLIYLAGPAIIALVGCIWKMWSDFNNFKLHVAENYVKQRVLEDVNRTMTEMKALLYEIAAKVGVSVNRPF